MGKLEDDIEKRRRELVVEVMPLMPLSCGFVARRSHICGHHSELLPQYQHSPIVKPISGVPANLPESQAREKYPDLTEDELNHVTESLLHTELTG